MPAWLEAVPAGTRVLDVDAFFSSRVVFYPGGCSDGHPLLVFGRKHAAHCFLYVDQWYTQARLIDTLDGRHRGYDARVRGYHTHARVDVDVESIVAANFDTALPERSRRPFGRESESPVRRVPRLAMLEILERDDSLDDTHGTRRLAILFVAADAYDVFESAFVRCGRAPYAIVLQDHGFGGNHDRFGGGGRLDLLADEHARPQWLVVAANTRAWGGYEELRSCGSGGMHRHARSLFVRRTSHGAPHLRHWTGT
jgi:hypothetical protein